MHLFYSPNIKPEQALHLLPEEESKHCIKVLRLGLGSEIALIDGKGGRFIAEITDPHPRRTLVKIISISQHPNRRQHYLHIAIAPTKNIERFEWFLEKATEIGIDEITPIVCTHSERKEIKIERLNKRITAAMKQSLQMYRPKLNALTSFTDLLKSVDHQGQKFIAHCMESERSSLKSTLKIAAPCLVLIGPEGDFSPAEIELALEGACKPISLGDSRLRTETAGLVACFEVNFLNQS